MKEKIFWYRWGVAILLLIALSSSVWAAGAIIQCNGLAGSGYAYDQAGTATSDKLGTTSVIQWVSGSQTAPNPDAWTANEVLRYNVGFGASGAGEFYFAPATQTGAHFLRVWENGAPAREAYYFATPASASGPSDILPQFNPIPNFNTNYKATVPYAPTFGGVSEILRKDTSGSYTLEMGLSVSGGTTGTAGYRVELAPRSPGSTNYRIQVRKEGEADFPAEGVAADSVRTFDTNGSITMTGSYYTPSTTYYFRARAYNYFGAGPWATFGPYPSGRMGGGVASVTYPLKKADGGLGLNAIAAIHTVPFSVDTAPASSVGTIGQLVDAINAKSASKNVVTFGWMEDGNATLQGWYITYDASGTATYTPTSGITTGPDTPLVANRIYQISVLQNVDVTFTSQ